MVANGIQAEALRAEPRGRWPIRHVGFIGTVIPSKGVHVLVEAFNLLGREELVLDVYGEAVPYHEKTDYSAELEAAVKPGLEVRFHGRYEHHDLRRIQIFLQRHQHGVVGVGNPCDALPARLDGGRRDIQVTLLCLTAVKEKHIQFPHLDR